VVYVGQKLIGTIIKHDGRYEAFDAFGRCLGNFSTRADATRSISHACGVNNNTEAMNTALTCWQTHFSALVGREAAMAGLLEGSRRHHDSRTTLAVRAMGHVNDGGQAVIGNMKKSDEEGCASSL
jgi:hypothetical protein